MASELRPGDLGRLLDRIAKASDRNTAKALPVAAEHIAADAKENAHVATGRLRAGMSVSSPRKTTEGWTIGIGVEGVPYSRFHPRIFHGPVKATRPRIVGLIKPMYKSWR